MNGRLAGFWTRRGARCATALEGALLALGGDRGLLLSRASSANRCSRRRCRPGCRRRRTPAKDAARARAADAADAEPRAARGGLARRCRRVGRRYPAFGVTQHHMAHVYEAPKREARVPSATCAAARAFAPAKRSRARTAHAAGSRCSGGGFVCNGEGVTSTACRRPTKTAPMLPALSDAAALPLSQGRGRTDVPQYLRLPTPAKSSRKRDLREPARADAGRRHRRWARPLLPARCCACACSRAST